MFLVSPLVSVTGNLLHSLNAWKWQQALIDSLTHWWENMRLPEMALKLPSMKIWHLSPHGQMLEASVLYTELYWWIEKTWWGSRFHPIKYLVNKNIYQSKSGSIADNYVFHYQCLYMLVYAEIWFIYCKMSSKCIIGYKNKCT